MADNKFLIELRDALRLTQADFGKRVKRGLSTIQGYERGGRVRASAVPDRKKRTLQPEIKANVQAGSALYSDALLSYDGLERGDWVTSKEAIGDMESLEEREDINHVWSRAARSPEQGDRRIKANQPADTIHAECHGNIQYHYSLPRRISMREAARFQSFPDNFIFAAKLRETERQVGNAVPPVLAWHIANSVLRSLA